MTRLFRLAEPADFARLPLNLALIGLLALTACSEPPPAEQLQDAKALLAQRQERGAVIQLKSALQRQPDLLEARFLLGKTLFSVGDLPGALIELNKAKEAGYPADEVVPVLVTAMLTAGQLDRLIADYGDTELKAQKPHAELKAVLATAQAMKGRSEQAKVYAEDALRADASNLGAQLVLVRLKAAAGQLDAALAMVETVAQAHQTAAAPRLLRAELLSALGQDADRMLEAYGEVLKVDPSNIVAMGTTVGLLGRKQEFEAAQQRLAQMQKTHPKHPLTLFHGTLLASQRGDNKLAHEQVQALLKLTPEHPRALHLGAIVAYQRGAYLEASAMLGKAMQRSESQSDIRTLLARTYLRLGEPGRALVAIRPVVEAEAAMAEAYAVAAEAHLQQGDAKAAQRLFDKAVQRNPDDQRSRTALALARAGDVQPEVTDAALRQIGAEDKGVMADMALIAVRVSRRQLPEALEAIDVLERKQPGRPLAPMLRGRIELLRGNVAKAREHFEAAQALDLQYIPAVAALAGLDIRDGKRDAAVARYEKLVQAKSSSLEAEMAIIGLRSESGVKFDELAALIGETIKRHPNEPQPRLALVKARLDAGQIKQALAAAQEGVAAFPSEPAFYDLLARAQQMAGDLNQAMAAATKLAAIQPNSPVPHMRLAEVSLALRDGPAAIGHLTRALSVRDDYLPAQSALAGVLGASGKPVEARAVALAVQKQRPKEPAGWALAGDVEAMSGQPAAAVQAYRAALQRGAGGDVAVRLHAALMRSKATEEARRFETLWLSEQVKDVAMRLYLSEIAMRGRNFTQAEKLLSEVVQLQPNNVLALNNLAWSQQQLGKSEALATIERARQLAPEAAVVLDTLASIQSAAGKLDEALATQRRAVAAAPDKHEHRLQLAQFLARAGKPAEAKQELEKLAALGNKFPQQAEVKALMGKL